jgi:hypothetical protein
MGLAPLGHSQHPSCLTTACSVHDKSAEIDFFTTTPQNKTNNIFICVMSSIQAGACTVKYLYDNDLR